MKPIEEMGFWKFMERLMRFMLIAASVAIVIIIGIAVFMRYIMHSVFFGSDELLSLLAIWLYWMGGAYGSYEDSHISADMTNLFIKNKKAAHIVKICVRGATALITTVFAYWSIVHYAIGNFQDHTITTALRMPYVVSKMALTTGFCLMAFYSIYHFIREFHPQAASPDSDERTTA